MENRQMTTRSERAFRSLVRVLPTTEALGLLTRMRACLGKPEPARVWCVVRMTGGCDVITSGEISSE